MGDYADYFNEHQADSMEDLLSWESGAISRAEATDRGVLDETTGEVDGDVYTWGIHDAEILLHELDRCELTLQSRLHSMERHSVPYWESHGILYRPCDMTTSHLRNAIAYAERHSLRTGVVDQMRQELQDRLLKERRSCDDGSG